jgi:hypothetical protein
VREIQKKQFFPSLLLMAKREELFWLSRKIKLPPNKENQL